MDGEPEHTNLVPKVDTLEPRSISINKQNELGDGAEGQVYGVQVVLDYKGKKKGNVREVPWTMAYKVLDVNKATSVNEVIDTYSVAKEAKLPVPNTFRLTESGNILMTDLTNGGEYLVLAPNDFVDSDKKIKKLVKEYPELVDIFINKVDLSIEKFEEKIKDYSELAAKKHLQFYHDSWFLIVKPDGSFDLCLADLGNMRSSSNRTKENIERTNNYTLTGVINTFEKLQSSLRQNEY